MVWLNELLYGRTLDANGDVTISEKPVLEYYNGPVMPPLGVSAFDRSYI